MTSPELIALLRSRPKACGRLGITFRHFGGRTDLIHDEITIEDFFQVSGRRAAKLKNWLTGAAVNEFVRRGWTLPVHCLGEFWMLADDVNPTDATKYPTILHALLAAIEASEETTT